MPSILLYPAKQGTYCVLHILEYGMRLFRKEGVGEKGASPFTLVHSFITKNRALPALFVLILGIIHYASIKITVIPKLQTATRRKTLWL